MSYAIWVAIALVCFVLPATTLTSGGKRDPEKGKLAEYARNVGLPLPEEVVEPVVARIKRRQRGMVIGGIIGIVIATMIFILLFTNDDQGVGVIAILFAAMGTSFGGALAIAAHRPAATSASPVVARVREVTLSDYLTGGERFGLWAAPAVIIAGSVAGFFVMRIFPTELTTYRPGFGLVGAGLALVTWAAAIFAIQQVLAAPARSGSDLELAWDDAERADGLRQVANLAVAVASLAVAFWLIFIAEILTSNGFYRDNLEFSYLITAIAIMTFIPLVVFTAAGPVIAWATGKRKGYEQRRLWPEGVAAPREVPDDEEGSA